MDEQVFDDLRKLIYNDLVCTQDVVWRTCWMRWTIESTGERERERERENHGNLCKRHDMMLLLIYIYISNWLSLEYADILCRGIRSSRRKGILDMTQNYIWYRGSISGYLERLQYLLIAIIFSFSPPGSSSTSWGKICWKIIFIRKEYE